MMRSPCCEKDHTNKGAWTKEEDERLVSYINAHGESSSRSLPKSAGLNRCGKSCRLRWINYLRPDLKRGNFTPQEDQLIVSLHAVLGNKWSMIASRLPGFMPWITIEQLLRFGTSSAQVFVQFFLTGCCYLAARLSSLVGTEIGVFFGVAALGS
ncbi:hypothetical protein LXL04_035099 [Taraxacum kok-saghyz]